VVTTARVGRKGVGKQKEALKQPMLTMYLRRIGLPLNASDSLVADAVGRLLQGMVGIGWIEGGAQAAQVHQAKGEANPGCFQVISELLQQLPEFYCMAWCTWEEF
jgi:hypothetical protein